MADERSVDGDNLQSVDDMLNQQARLESLIREKFSKVLAVMFTDLKGSTAMAETDGDVATRMLIKEHIDLVTAVIREHHGTFVKSIGDGTLSYFENAQDALRAAAAIQVGMDAINLAKKFKSLALVRVGIHSGTCLVEDGDLFGDTINTASRFESSANAGEILLSEDAYNALSDKSEIYCRFDRTITLKGKKDAHDAYRAFWNSEEIERDKSAAPQSETDRAPTSKLKIAVVIVSALIIVLIISLWAPIMKSVNKQPETRTLQHSLDTD